MESSGPIATATTTTSSIDLFGMMSHVHDEKKLIDLCNSGSNNDCTTMPKMCEREDETAVSTTSSNVVIDFTNADEPVFLEKMSTDASELTEPFRSTLTTSASTAEINHVLNDFNEILDNADLEYEIHDLQLNNAETRDFIVKSMENLSEMLLGAESALDAEPGSNSGSKVAGEVDELLIIVETSDSEPSVTETDQRLQDSTNETPEPGQDEFAASEYGDPTEEEGYESDRPMMGRASMRRLKPIQMLPMPSSSGSKFPAIPEISEKRTAHPHPQPSTSAVTNMILVTSLINNPAAAPGANDESTPEHVPHQFPNRVETEELVQFDQHGSTEAGAAAAASDARSGTTMSDETISSSAGGSTSRRSTTTIQVDPTALLSSCAPVGAGTTAMDSCSSATTSATASTGSGTATGSSPTTTPTVTRTTVIRHANRSITIPGQDEDSNNNSSSGSSSSSNGRWPHRLSSMLALLGCTLGLNNICRFSLLSVQYGANFSLQFLILSFIIGLPLLTFHMSIGQYLNAGIVDMWKISPIFQGIGIGLVISQAMIGIYTAVGVSWMFIYFRDSFITKFDQYRWGKCLHDYRGCDPFSNNTLSLSETVPDYFNGVVLQRSTPDYPSSYFPTSLKFTVAFNLAVVWMLVFVSLSKGLKSYGKVIHGFVLIPIISVLILASKMVGIVPTDDTGSLFGQTEWTNFFFNSQTWVLAAREAFFTWGVLGACIMQITSHNRHNHSLKSDASIVILITMFVLFLSAFIGNACYSILLSQGYFYVPSSFESMRTYEFLVKKPPDFPPGMQILPTYMNQHTSFLMGVRINKPEGFPVIDSNNLMINTNSISGYQALRIATELYPATMAVLGSPGLSPFWTVLFYFTCILFGIAQQLAIWHCVIRGVTAINKKVLKSWETTITFFVCALGFGLGLPLCTELGIFIIYFLDYCIGSGWWIMVLYLLELVAVFVVRGAPYCGENIVTVFMTGSGKFTKCFAPLISFVWNVILPVTMLVLSIASFKSGNIRELYDWSFSSDGYVFWPSWTRELGSFIQLLPILTVPFVAVVQSCRYLTNGPSDLFDRMQELYRPHSRGLGRHHAARRGRGTNENGNGGDTRTEDPPPKYTPPPSYSTATSARIAKFLRASIRRSIRRISNPGPSSAEDLPPPPNYASVILEIHNQQQRSVADSFCTTSAGVLPTITVTGSGNETSSRLSNTNDILLPILSPLSTSNSPSPVPSYETAIENAATSNANDDKNTKSDSVAGSSQNATAVSNLGYQEFERSSLRRIASDITPSDVARILRATYQTAKSANVNMADLMNVGPEVTELEINSVVPFYDFSLDRHSIDSDQFYSCNSSNNNTFQSTHSRTSSYPRTAFYNNFIDFSRCSRRSNDSQIALILDPSRRESLASDILANEEFLSSLMATRQDGIVNPTFQLSNDEPSTSTSNNIATSTATAMLPSSSSSLSTSAAGYSGSSNSNCTVISKGLADV